MPSYLNYLGYYFCYYYHYYQLEKTDIVLMNELNKECPKLLFCLREFPGVCMK